MPIVHVDLSQFSGVEPGLEPDNGSVWFWPYRPYVEDSTLVSREVVKIKTVDGIADPVLPQTPLTEAVWVQLRAVKGAGTPWLVQIPATDCNLFDLPHIDPDSLDPEVEPSPYWLNYMNTAIADAIDGVLDGAPAAMDTLAELAAALGDDPNFATTIVNSLGAKADLSALNTEQTAREGADQTLAQTISDYADTLNTALGTKAATTALTAETAARTTAVATKRDDPWRFDSTRGRAIKAALAKRATTPVDIAGMGASWMAGSGALATSARWWDVAQGLARTRWSVSGAAGSLGYRESYSFTPGYTTPFTYTGSPVVNANFGLGRKTLIVPNGQNVKMTIPTGGTGVKILYGKGPTGGNFTWQVGAGSATTVSASAAAASTAGLDITAAAGTLVTIAATTAGLYFQGAYFYGGDETKGLRFWNGGTSGYRTADFMDVNGWTYDAYTIIDPDLFIIDLGANDYSGGTAAAPVSVATYKSNLAALVGNVRTRCTKPPTVLLQLFPQITNGAVTTLAPWADYRAAALEWAQADGQIGVWDLAPIFGSMVGTDTYSITAGDQAHPNPAGYAAIAEQFADVLATA